MWSLEKKAEYQREWRRKNIDKVSRYIQSGKEKMKVLQHSWYLKNKDRVAKDNKKWIENNPDKERARHQRYRKNNPEKVRIQGRLYQHLRRAGGELSEETWCKIKSAYNDSCARCLVRESDGISLTIDHIVPVIFGGTNDPKNIQPLCKSCNSSKGTKTIRYPIPSTVGREVAIK